MRSKFLILYRTRISPAKQPMRVRLVNLLLLMITTRMGTAELQSIRAYKRLPSLVEVNSFITGQQPIIALACWKTIVQSTSQV